MNNFYTEFSQKINPFVGRNIFVFGIAVLIKYLPDAGGENNPRTGNAGR